jgi:multicomponent K+:H+ antiporter subunit D
MYTLVFPTETAATGPLFADLLLPAALVTLVLGAVGVLGAKSLSRMVAFGAIASMGTLFIAVAQFTPQATTAALYYLLHSTLATAALFLITDQVIERRGTGDLATARPPIAQGGLIAALFFGAAIALAGMPPLSGFLGKLLVLDATRDQAWLVWPVILASSLVTIVGFAMAGSQLFWKAHASAPSPEAAPQTRAEVLPLVAIFGLLGLLVLLTVFAGPVTDWLAVTADGLHQPAPYIEANDLQVWEE